MQTSMMALPTENATSKVSQVHIFAGMAVGSKHSERTKGNLDEMFDLSEGTWITDFNRRLCCMLIEKDTNLVYKWCIHHQ